MTDTNLNVYETVEIVWPIDVKKLIELDKSYIGTENYMGIAYFWSAEYKHYMRGATSLQRRKIHDEILYYDLPLNGEDDAILKIIQKNLNTI